MITVRWVNPNSTGLTIDEIRIYRSTSPMDTGSLPTPISTISGDSTYYEDDTAVDGTSYYYRVQFISGSQSAVSAEQQITAPSGQSAPLSPLALISSAAHLYDSTGSLLYSLNGDRVQNEWASVRKILSGLVVVEEKGDVLDSELVTVTSDDIAVATEWQSGFSAGDQVTWRGLLDLMLVPSKTDAAHTVNRVMGQHLLDKYGIGGTVERAMGYWMATTAIRSGARNVITLTNRGSTPYDEILSGNMYAPPSQLSRCLEFVLKNSTMGTILQQQSVSVPVAGGGTLNWNSVDTLQRTVTIGSTTDLGGSIEDYIAGKTGDGTWGNQVFAYEMPSGVNVYGALWHSSTRVRRHQDIVRLLMQSENNFSHLRSSESVSDPDESSVFLRVQGSSLPVSDSGPNTFPLTSSGVSSVSSDYMNANALRFAGSGYITAGENIPTLGSGDFTIEAFLRGNGTFPSGQRIVVGAYRSSNGFRGWQLSINDTHVLFIHSVDGNGFIETQAALPSSFILNGNLTHLCVMRSGSDLAVYVNGQSGEKRDMTGVTIFTPTSGTELVIGAREVSGEGSYEQGITADIDEVIITPGVARYSPLGFRPTYRSNRWG